MTIVPIGIENFGVGITFINSFCINFAFLILNAKIMFKIILTIPIILNKYFQSIPCSENIASIIRNIDGGTTIKIIATITNEIILITILINIMPSLVNTFSFIKDKNLMIGIIIFDTSLSVVN